MLDILYKLQHTVGPRDQFKPSCVFSEGLDIFFIQFLIIIKIFWTFISMGKGI